MENRNVIDGFEELTPQQVFDMALAHVRTTRQKSANSNGFCIYGGGIGCAASPFLTPKARVMFDEINSCWDDLVFAVKVPKHNVKLINDIQFSHDHAHEPFMKGFERNMRDVAIDHGLIYTPEGEQNA